MFILYKFQTYLLANYVIKNDKGISDRKLHSKYAKYTSFKMTTEVKSSYSNSAFTPNMIGHFEWFAINWPASHPAFVSSDLGARSLCSDRPLNCCNEHIMLDATKCSQRAGHMFHRAWHANMIHKNRVSTIDKDMDYYTYNVASSLTSFVASSLTYFCSINRLI